MDGSFYENLWTFKASYDKVQVYDTTRGCLVLAVGMCAGLAALIWAAGSLLRGRSPGRSSSLGVILAALLCDGVQLALSLVIMIAFLPQFWRNRAGRVTHMVIIIKMWVVTRSCGLLLHQLVALESVLSLVCPQRFSRLRSKRCALPASLAVWLVGVGVALAFGSLVPFIVMTSDLVSVGVAVTTCVLMCRCGARLSGPARQHGALVRSVALFSLVVLYGPYYVAGLLARYRPSLVCALTGMPALALANLRLISNPFLCVLVSIGQQIHV